MLRVASDFFVQSFWFLDGQYGPNFCLLLYFDISPISTSFEYSRCCCRKHFTQTFGRGRRGIVCCCIHPLHTYVRATYAQLKLKVVHVCYVNDLFKDFAYVCKCTYIHDKSNTCTAYRSVHPDMDNFFHSYCNRFQKDESIEILQGLLVADRILKWSPLNRRLHQQILLMCYHFLASYKYLWTKFMTPFFTSNLICTTTGHTFWPQYFLWPIQLYTPLTPDPRLRIHWQVKQYEPFLLQPSLAKFVTAAPAVRTNSLRS